ncbi:MAG: hypothetical protein QF664_10840 [Dehalococcoidia bacterium]|jgi:hypothetical protein|nr:hypothetical protein [Dehalococcoidia bacterium]
MPLGIKPADIADPELRAMMEQANAALDGGSNLECVQACAEAYLKVLETHENVMSGLQVVLATERVRVGLERGMIRTAPLMWPRFGAKLSLDGARPEITFDRTSMATGETIQYYEFTLDVIMQAQSGEVNTGPGGGAL